MALYAIGDVQGCFDELRHLLDRIRFNPAEDRLWFTGDLINRGPDSLGTLRFIRSLGQAAVAVLGNHDLHLLAVAYGVSRTKRKDTFGDVLAAADRAELLDWLKSLPLLHWDEHFLLVHAGLPPQWHIGEALAHAREVESVLRSNRCGEFFHHLYGDTPDLWSADLAGWDRLRFIVNCFTRMRYCDREGRLDFRHKGAPGSQRHGLMPWFDVPGRKSLGAAIVFGHWSTLGFRVMQGCYAIDTGCLWGGELTALRLDGEMYRVSVPSVHRGHEKSFA